jgi:two-component system, NtrC family, sensor histidine kinase KinB
MTWTLRRKILAGYGITLALTVVVLVWALVNLLHLGQASNAILRQNYRSILAAETMINAIERQDSATLLWILGSQSDGQQQFRDSEILFLQWLGRATDNITEPGEDQVVAEVEAGYSAYLDRCSALRGLQPGEPDSLRRFYHEKVFPAFKAVRDSCTRLREINEAPMFRASERAGQIARTAIWSTSVIGLAAVVIGLGFSFLLTRIILTPVRDMMRATNRISQGDYDVDVWTSSSDEIGHLAARFHEMARKVKSFHDMNIGQIVAEKRKSDAILMSIDDGILVVDSEFKISDLNPAAATALGVDVHGARGRHFLEVTRSELLFDHIRRAAESGRPLIPAEEGADEVMLPHGDSHRYYQFSTTPIYAGAGSMVGVVLVLRDITKLKELDRLKSEFVLMASHELRTPLTSIGMSVDLLMERIQSEIGDKEKQLLSAAHEEVERLKALISDLLDLSRIEAGKIDMEFERASVSLLLERAVGVLQAQADEKSVDLSMEIQEGLPPVKADPNKIVWVLTNLGGNALRFTDRGGHIRVAARRLGPQVHISVHDDGVGIPQEYQSKIFDKFVQVQTHGGREGSGLGLAICKEIVRAHGGTIWVDSTPGQGSVFTFTLPVAVQV